MGGRERDKQIGFVAGGNQESEAFRASQSGFWFFRFVRDRVSYGAWSLLRWLDCLTAKLQKSPCHYPEHWDYRSVLLNMAFLVITYWECYLESWCLADKHLTDYAISPVLIFSVLLNISVYKTIGFVRIFSQVCIVCFSVIHPTTLCCLCCICGCSVSHDICSPKAFTTSEPLSSDQIWQVQHSLTETNLAVSLTPVFSLPYRQDGLRIKPNGRACTQHVKGSCLILSTTKI